MLRFIALFIVLIGFLILSIPILIIEWIVGKFSSKVKSYSSLRIVQAVFRFMLFLCGIKVEVIGKENIPKNQAVLYIGNHRSYFDTLITYAQCRELTGYIAKKEMQKFPLLNIWMSYLHCLFLDRQNIKEGLKVILAAIEKIESGISICIFPEGTRSKNAVQSNLLEFHEGSFKIAQRAKCPVVPMVLYNTSAILEDHFPRIRPTRVILEYLPCVDLSKLEGDCRKFPGAYCRDLITQKLKEKEKNS